ncbi:MAG: ATP-dependent Clp protease ATP-binding subunit [Candidatus Nomurabacteria bacterium]|jgi:ATP-dependent Clp protease ATP-binding subunit ClpC|nr:ATP-dependent Clp protease ATP-binding subunit [Candidatus Nomurabacteria bacterium]
MEDMMDDFAEMMSHLTDDARMVLQKADYFAKKYAGGFMGTEHVLLGILAHDSSMASKLLLEQDITLEKAEHTIGAPAAEVKVSHVAMMSFSEAVVLTLRMSWNVAQDLSSDRIDSEHILLALLSQNNSKAVDILLDLGADVEKLMDDVGEFLEKQNLVMAGSGTRKGQKTPLRFLSKYGTDLTALAAQGKLDTVIGREKEIERMVTVLSRRTKSNPVLIGEAGVGKTAIVEGVADRIAKNAVPECLIGYTLYQIDLAGMVAGTKYRGEFEERLKGLLSEVEAAPKTLLFIDELHLLAGAGSAEGSMDAANMLKPALARGQIKLIGATTFDEYRKHIEKDKALARRLQTVIVDEPDENTVFAIIKGIKKHYETHHNVVIPDEVIKSAVFMTSRYLAERTMPDKVIDILDEASAIARVESDKKGGNVLKKMLVQIDLLTKKIELSAERQDYEKAAVYKTELAKLETEVEKIKKDKKKLSEMTPKLSLAHIARAISLKTGIPVDKVHGNEADVLRDLEQHLGKYVLGQEEAIAKVAKAIRRGRSGISNTNRPIGSFIFMGPTGVGKTELARVIAREVFGGADALVKIDMSEFGEKHNVSRLVGAPAGYVGYDDGGKLTEMVRRHPYSVVLFDEIEKAHKEVFNMLLQILEDGVLTDAKGEKIRFNNTIVILTSNLGAEEMMKEAELGFTAKSRHKQRDLQLEHEKNVESSRKALRKMMRPELLNRFDSVVVFNSLSEKDVAKILDNFIVDLQKRLSVQGIGIKVEPSAKKYLIKKGYDVKNGARPLRRALEDELETLLAEEILSGKVKKGTVFTVKADKNQLSLCHEA